MRDAIGTDSAVSNKCGANGCLGKRANSMFSWAKSKGMDWGTIDTLPEIVGLALHTDGHVGYYVGNGYAVEWRGFRYGCVRTKVKDRRWKYWYKLPFIQYREAAAEIPAPEIALGSRLLKRGMVGSDVKALQELLLQLGFALPKHGADAEFGSETEKALLAFQKKAGLEANKAALEAAKAELETQKKQLSAQRDEANKLVKEIDDNAAEYQATLKELEAEERRIEQQVKQMQKKLEEQMAAEGKKYNTNPGGYIWPVDSRYITSTVGGRNSPGGVGSTNHKGTDIGRVGYTSPVYAAKAGTVIIAQRSSSYGNYVVISHGVGNTTLYAHMSSIKVSVGTYVKQGQTIGITGSTGHSTGPHLHFEVVENNVRINPLSHGAAPKKGYLTGYTLSGTSVGK